MDDIVADAVTSPPRVGEVGQDVCISGKHRHWDLCDVLEREKVGGPLLMPVKPVLVIIREDLEAILPQVLRVVKDSFYGSSIGFMTHVHSEPVGVVQ
jgi:hypothetical protein